MGSIKLNKDEMLRLAGELSALREQVNSILLKTQETESVLKREGSVSTFSQRNKLTNVQDLAFNLLREFEKASDGFYAGAAAYDNAEDKISKLTIMQRNIGIGNVPSVSLKESRGSLSSENKKGNETDALEKLKELSREGWSFLQSKFKEKLSAVDFLKDICDTIDTQVEGFLKSHEEFIAEFNAEHPKLSILLRPLEAKLGIADGTLLFAKEMTVDLAGMILDFVSYEAHGLLEDPVKTLKENAEVLNTIKAILSPVTLEEHEVRINAILGIWRSVKDSIDTNIVNGDAYTSSRFITDVGLNIASFFYGAGEVKAASKAGKGKNAIKAVDSASDISKVEKLTNGEKWFNYFNKAYGAENVEWTSKIFEGNNGLRERVFANIEKSRLARESSNFKGVKGFTEADRIKQLNLSNCKEKMISKLDTFRKSILKDPSATGNTFSISMDCGNISKNGIASNKIYQFNPTILDYNDPRRFCLTQEQYCEYYRYTLSDAYIDSMPSKFIENINKNSVKLEMNKLREAIESTKDTAKSIDSINAFGQYSLEQGWNVENCAEIWGARNAILNGASFDDLIIRTVDANGKVKLPCKNCLNTFKNYYIVD